MPAFSNHKISVDLLIPILATIILASSILSISTNSWNIKYGDSVTNRTGLFQQCSNNYCCDTQELDRSITLFALISIVLLLISTFSSFLFMATAKNCKNRCYVLVPLTLFGAGITMTLTVIQILDRLYLNGYSAFTFIIDTILTYFLGGISLVHANMFYL